MKKTPERLAAIIETLQNGNVAYAEAARANGITPSLFWEWTRRSQLRTDAALFVDYLGERMPFHCAVACARQIALHESRGYEERRIWKFLGTPVVYFEGAAAEPAPPIDPELEEMLRIDPAPVVEPGENDIPSGHVIDDDLTDTLDHEEPERVPDEVEGEPALGKVSLEAEPERVPDKVAIDEAPHRVPRSDLERDLFERLAAARAKNAPRVDVGTGETQASPEASYALGAG